mgnify:CR=1 FL=1
MNTSTRRLARWIRKPGRQQGRLTMNYALCSGNLGTGKRLWGWYAVFTDDAAQMRSVAPLLEAKERAWTERGYKILPYV